MHVHPDIAALRSDPALQRRARSKMDEALMAWRAKDEVRAIQRCMAELDQGTSFEQVPALRDLLTDLPTAQAFVDDMIEVFGAAMKAEPLGEVPFQHNSNRAYSRMQIAQAGHTVLSLAAYEPAKPMKPDAIQFVDCTAFEIIIAGSAQGIYCERIETAGQVQILTERRSWSAGDRIERRALNQARQFVEVEQTLLVLQLSKAPQNPLPSCVYRLVDGELIQQASGDKRASEQLMALSVLGLLDRAEAPHVFRQFAAETEHDTEARWEAVRQLVATDAEAGLDLLDRLSRRQFDPLSDTAATLRDQLLSAHPILRNKHKELV